MSDNRLSPSLFRALFSALYRESHIATVKHRRMAKTKEANKRKRNEKRGKNSNNLNNTKRPILLINFDLKL